MEEKALKELKSIKNLLVLQLLKSEVSAKSIAKLINMDTADFSREFPVRKLLSKNR